MKSLNAPSLGLKGARLVGTTTEEIVQQVERLLNDVEHYQSMARVCMPWRWSGGGKVRSAVTGYEMKILFVLPRMVSGGVERVTLRLIAGLQARGHECAFALRRSYGEFLPEAESLCPVYEVAAGGLHQFVPNLSRLIRTWQPSHIVTAFADVGVLACLAIKQSGLQPCWVHGVHGTHDVVTANPGWMGRLRYQLDQYFSAWVYRKADKIVAVSHGVREDILQRFKVDANKVVTIYNPVLDESQLIPRASSVGFASPPKIVALGRLTREKGFDILIEAMKQVPQPWRLEIWGDGAERVALQSQIETSGLQEHIILCGHTSLPLEILRQADIFVLSSRCEGLPTVLIEALCGQAIIVSTSCPHGPEEILAGGHYGVLVANESPRELAIGLTRGLNQTPPASTAEMLERAADFSVNTAVRAWEKTLLFNRDHLINRVGTVDS